MKSPFLAYFGKLILGTSFLLILSTANAQSIVPNTGGDTIASIKYMGSQDEMLVFDLAYSNPNGGKFLVMIKDQDGGQLYQGLFSEKSIYKQFRLPMPERDRVVFVIRDFRDADIVKTFDVNINSRFIREVGVKKID